MLDSHNSELSFLELAYCIADYWVGKGNIFVHINCFGKLANIQKSELRFSYFD